jgi:hypothetical protein
MISQNRVPSVSSFYVMVHLSEIYIMFSDVMFNTYGFREMSVRIKRKERNRNTNFTKTNPRVIVQNSRTVAEIEDF